MHFKYFLSALLVLLVSSAQALEQSGWQVSQAGTWSLLPHGSYQTGAGSASRFLRVDEAVPHRKASLLQRSSITRTFTFSVSCLLQSPTPVLELEVPALDIRMADSFNGFVFARMRVDEGEEYSLRAEITPPGRLIFAPLTQSQQQILTALEEELKLGKELTIALLQGRGNDPRRYQIPLEGLSPLMEEVANDCTALAAAAGNAETSFLPDYLTAEGKEYADEDFSLKPKDGLDPVVIAPQPEPRPEPQINPADNPQIPFTGSGAPASIDAEGNVITSPGAGNSNAGSNAGAGADGSGTGAGNGGGSTDNGALSTPAEPMQIDENGMPIF